MHVESGDETALTQEFAQKMAIDLDLDGVDGSDLDFPVQITMDVPEGFDASSMKLFHIHDGVEEEVKFTSKGGAITFKTVSFSPFVFAQDGTGSETEVPDITGSDITSSDDDDSVSYGSSSGITRNDSQKGVVNSNTGIVTGSGEGYSRWQSETNKNGSVSWRLCYADGTYASGTVTTDQNGHPQEQPAWELVDGAWFAFGSNGYAVNGFVFDPYLGGTFYIDINTGMVTGWRLNNGWYVDKNGIWDGQKQK